MQFTTSMSYETHQPQYSQIPFLYANHVGGIVNKKNIVREPKRENPEKGRHVAIPDLGISFIPSYSNPAYIKYIQPAALTCKNIFTCVRSAWINKLFVYHWPPLWFKRHFLWSSKRYAHDEPYNLFFWLQITIALNRLYFLWLSYLRWVSVNRFERVVFSSKYTFLVHISRCRSSY